jgi:CubicO group peptidase (beta-lactamase class C family)
MVLSKSSLFVFISQMLVCSMVPVSTMAQEKSFSEAFHDFSEKHSRFAISASYALGEGEPVVMTAGPTVKNGSIMVPNDARWHIGSISKSFTSTLVMRLVEKGQLDLDAPIERYLSRYSDQMHSDWKAVSLRDLLSHTARMPSNAPGRITEETFDDEAFEGRRTVLAAMWDKPLKGEIGRFEYSNTGYVLAGLIIEEVTGQAWEDAIRTEIAQPFGLSSLGFGAPQETDAPRGHKSTFGFKSPVEPQELVSDNPKWMGPAGTIHLSMADLAKWGQLHTSACSGHQPEFLTQESCQIMQSPVSSDYGLGWVIQNSDKTGQVVWHNGSNTMWYAMLILVPDRNLVVATATNVFKPERIDELTQNLIALVPKK